MNIKNKKTVVGSIASLALIGGVAATGVVAANAASGTSSASQSEKGEANDAPIKGSISVAEPAQEESDAAEAAKLAKLATVDKKAANAAAVDTVPGSSVVETDLEEEDGFLVYEVDVKDTAGVTTEVIIDAGNTKVLASEVEGDEESDAAESARLAKLAKVDEKAANAAALDSVPEGSVVETSLDEEDGAVVYEVDVKDAADVTTEVVIDAENAKVLASEVEGNEANEGTDSPEGSGTNSKGEANETQQTSPSATNGK